jgi:hypothetical protein
MDTLIQQPVERMADDEVLAAFDTAEDPARRGFDQATYGRVLAYELVRSRQRLANYRTLYASFVEDGAPFMVENLDEASDGGAVPVKLVFADAPEQVQGLEEQADVVVWTEPELLAELAEERAVHDFLTALLDEIEPAVMMADGHAG